MPLLLVAFLAGGSGFALSSWASGLLNKLFMLGLVSAGVYYLFVRGA